MSTEIATSRFHVSSMRSTTPRLSGLDSCVGGEFIGSEESLRQRRVGGKYGIFFVACNISDPWFHRSRKETGDPDRDFVRSNWCNACDELAVICPSVWSILQDLRLVLNHSKGDASLWPTFGIRWAFLAPASHLCCIRRLLWTRKKSGGVVSGVDVSQRCRVVNMRALYVKT